MNILYLGDIYGQRGIDVVGRLLADLRKEYDVDLVIAQGENTSEGRSLIRKDYETLRNFGVDVFTGGNWSLFRPEALELLEDPEIPVIRPANYPEGTAGKGWFVAGTHTGKVLVVSLLGSIVGKDADKPTDNPLRVIDRILDDLRGQTFAAIVVNLHGDFSSEKMIIGYYLDGRAALVAGDHWHTPTADAMVLPKGTAHITDVGMCGVLHASLGVKLDVVIDRWKNGHINRNEPEMNGPLQLNGVLVDVDEVTGLARSIQQVQRVI